MQRREFVRLSVGAGLSLTAAVPPVGYAIADNSGTGGTATHTDPAQSEDGVVIHASGNDVMRGNPPAANKVVTLGNYESSRSHHSWSAQHLRELCPTQVIARGRGHVSVLQRSPRDVNALVIQDLKGQPLSVGDFLTRSYTEAFLVLHEGRILTEQYWSGMTPDRPHRLYSAAKSLLANVVAILADEGTLSLEAGIDDYVHELAASAYAGATLRQLLDMQSGVKYEYDLQGAAKSATEHGRHYRAAGMYPKLPDEDPQSGQYDFLVSLKTAAREHGQIFCYKCSDTVALMWACERTTGWRYADLLGHHVWSQLGAEHDASIVCDAQGAATPFGGMSTTLRDLARWGQMHLENGTLCGRRVLPESFIPDVRDHADPEKITADSGLLVEFLTPGWAYRSQYFRPAGPDKPIYAVGAAGQYCYVHPACHTVIAKFSTHGGVDPELGRLEVHAFRQIAESVSS